MSLYVKLYINEDKLKIFAATRVTNKTTGWNTYEISEYPEKPWGEIRNLGTIRHKYEDGADVLSRKVLTFATKKVK
jgi:hypothetical protein